VTIRFDPAAIRIHQAPIRCMPEDVRVHPAAIRETLARIRSRQPPSRERRGHVQHVPEPTVDIVCTIRIIGSGLSTEGRFLLLSSNF